MLRMRNASIALVAVLSMTVSVVPAANAQSVSPAATTDQPASASTPKQVRKAKRKMARARKNAELSSLKKNGFSPGGDQENYPSNIQSAERKMQASKAGASNPTATSAN